MAKDKDQGLSDSPQSTSAPTTPAATIERNPMDNLSVFAAGFETGKTLNSPGTPGTTHTSSTIGHGGLYRRGPKAFRSRRVDKTKLETPWTAHKDPKEKWVTILPIIAIFLGLCASGVLVWNGYTSVITHNYKLVLSEDWSAGFNSDIWTKELQVGGFGNSEFEQTTEENVYVQDGILYIGATMQDTTLLENPTVINLTADGTCTSSKLTDCVAITNTTTHTIVPPVLSGRINTKKSVNIKYGRVEVTAKLPVGDWLWPAIWMLPVNDTYGTWPASGEIDIMESRGNNHTYAPGGNQLMASTLHWGPNSQNDAAWRTTSRYSALHGTFSDDFHVFGLEWSQKYLFMYLDGRLKEILYVPFDQSFWSRGNFPNYDENYVQLDDPWTAGTKAAPFDQEYYLIINLAVGGTSGWFEDGVADKPWQNIDGTNARRTFWQAKDKWLPTWTQPSLQIKKVDIWQQNDGNEDL